MADGEVPQYWFRRHPDAGRGKRIATCWQGHVLILAWVAGSLAPMLLCMALGWPKAAVLLAFPFGLLISLVLLFREVEKRTAPSE